MSIIRNLTSELSKYLDTEEILLLVGSRQAGKTTILYQLQDILKKKGGYFLNLQYLDFNFRCGTVNKPVADRRSININLT